MNTEMKLSDLWDRLLPLLEKSLNRPIFETLVSSTKPLALLDGKFQIAVPNDVVKEWLSKHCITLLEQEAKAIDPSIVSAEFVLGAKDLFTTPDLDMNQQTAAEKSETAGHRTLFLNPRYTFDMFVIGHGNRFAHAASQAVAEAPARAYNPLFLYGGVGLGKTHLMQAIGHHVYKNNPRTRILYISSETFTNELINSIRDDKTIQFRNKYRNIDILLVDDIQFLAGKERTQEEFFHTFNALYEAGKQIVLSSDRPPKEIPTLEHRLLSRFEWGLTADIQPPDYETRIAILKKKSDQSELQISDEILTYIASKVMTNIRELEGALIRVVAYSALNSTEITPALIDNVLKDILKPEKAQKTSLSIEAIIKATADYYSVKIDDMSAKVRTKEIAMARQIAMYLSRELTGSSLPKIGEEFGGRDHTTVIHACDKIRKAIQSDPEIKAAIKSIAAGLPK